MEPQLGSAVLGKYVGIVDAEKPGFREWIVRRDGDWTAAWCRIYESLSRNPVSISPSGKPVSERYFEQHILQVTIRAETDRDSEETGFLAPLFSILDALFSTLSQVIKKLGRRFGDRIAESLLFCRGRLP
jgi:hypothetical protein